MNHYYIDLFCGAGGVTTGIHGTDARVIACVNHDPLAIESHETNHPDVLHFTEDIRTLDLTTLSKLVKSKREVEPDCVISLWASLECTNFSKAKGGQPRDADSRTLAHDLFRYVEELCPEIIWIENVVEFMSWGPLDEHGKPVSRRNGSDYLKWCNKVQNHGYNFDFKILNAADFGAYTSRIRYFAQFAKQGIPIVWPEPTHAKNPKSGMFTGLKKWKPVKDVLDFSDEGSSIFGRKKNLSEKTLERIYAGLVKYIAGGDTTFLTKYNGNNQHTGINQGKSINDPSPVVTTQGRLAVVNVHFISKYFSGRPDGKNQSLDVPAGSITTSDHHSLIRADFISKYYSNGDNTSSIDEPAPTVVAQDRLAIVKPVWLDKNYSGKSNHQDVDVPAGSISTKDHYALMKPCWIDRNFSSGGGKTRSIESPAGAVMTVPKMNLVQPKFLMDTQFNNKPASIEQPARTITANRKHFYLVNPQFNSKGSSIERPSFTLIARMDKAPPYLVEAETGEISIQINSDDSPCTVRIKEFMAAYGIIDIKMRMLRVVELLRIQGFPRDYHLAGNQSDQKKFIGNAVEVNMARVLAQTTTDELKRRRLEHKLIA